MTERFFKKVVGLVLFSRPWYRIARDRGFDVRHSIGFAVSRRRRMRYIRSYREYVLSLTTKAFVKPYLRALGVNQVDSS